jgi:hypothetical protein
MFMFRWRFQYPMLIGMVVLWVLFKINLLSTGWNIAVGLIVTSVLYVLLGVVSGRE